MAQSGPTPQLAGWFTKKAEKMGKSQKRFFELYPNEIRYFARAVRQLNADRGAEFKGNVVLSEMTTAQATGTRLIIANPDRTWELIADASPQAQQWSTAINNLCKPGRPSAASSVPAAPTSSTTTAAAPVSAASTRSPSVTSTRVTRRESTLASPPAAQPPPPPAGPAAVATPPPSSPPAATAHVADDGADDVPLGDGSGFWMLKKGEGIMARDQMRYFVLMTNRRTAAVSLAYFESTQNGQLVGRKGAIPLSSSSTLASRGPVVEIQNPDRLWMLTANSPDDATRICTLLRRLIATQSGAQNKQAWSSPTDTAAVGAAAPAAAVSATAADTAKPAPRSVPGNSVSPDTRALPADAVTPSPNDLPEDEAGAAVKEQETDVKTSARAAGVWLSKKGEGFGALTGEKRRYFILLYGIDSRMLKFTYFADVQHGRPVDRKGFVPLTAESRVSASGSHITIDNPGRVWQLNATSAEEAAHWAQVLTEAIQASSGVQSHSVPLSAPGSNDDEGNEASQETEEGVAAGMWLVKAGEGLGRDRRRWFVLQKGLASQTLRLTYFGDQRNGQGVDRKGCIALSSASSVGHDGKLVTISNPDRLWKLQADTPEEAATLTDVLRRALAPIQATAAAKTVVVTAVGETETDDLGIAELEKEVLGGAGAWFVKRGEGAGAITGGKKRYFVLRYGQNTNMLKFTYYADVVNGEPVDKKGFIPIGGLSSIYSQGKTLFIANPDRTWQLTADSTDDAAHWVPTLLKARATAAKWTNPELVDSDDEQQIVVADEEERAENNGEGAWFTKKGEGRLAHAKQRYFVLCTGQHTHSLRFVYYAGLRDGNPVSRIGAIPLTKSSNVSAAENVLTIVNPDRTWVLTAGTRSDAAHWSTVLTAAIAAPRAFDEAPLPTMIRSSYDEKLAEIETNIVLTPGRGGWFSKKGEGLGRDKLRYFVPVWGSKTGLLKFAYFASVDGTTPRDQKGFVPLLADSVVAVQDDLLCVKNRDRLWQLSATQASDPALWSRILTDALGEQSLSPSNMPALARIELLTAGKSNQSDVLKALETEFGAPVRARYEAEVRDRFAEDGETSGEVRDDYDDVEIFPGRGVWLHKKGEGLGLLSGDKRRYFVLVRRDSSRTLLFHYYTTFASGRPSDLKGSIDILPMTHAYCNGAELTIANSDRIWKLTAPTPGEALEWAQLIKSAIQQHYPTGEIPRGEEETPIAGLGVWLLKKGEGLGAFTGPKRRFFTLTRGTQSGLVKMAYAESEDSGPKGAILLSPLSNISSADRTVLIENPDRTWELTADSPSEAVRVVEALNAALGSHASGMAVSAGADEEIVPGLHVWLQKKGEGLGAIRDKWRFFVLTWRRATQTLLIAYYEDADAGIGADRKGTIAINASSVIASSGKKITIENPDRLWELTARSEANAAQIAAALHTAIRSKYQTTDDANGTGDEIDVCPGVGIWLRKKGEGVGALTGDKKRYFVLLFAQHARTLRMAYFAELVGTQPADRRGAIPVSGLSNIVARGAELRIDNPDRTWLLTADSELLAGQWADQLRRAIQEQKENTTTSMPLLARLQQILHTDYASHDVDTGAVIARLKREFSEATVAARTDDINKAVLLFEGTDPTRRVNDEDNEEEVVPGRGVWLAKRGEGAGVLTGSKKRYFVLVKGALSRLLRFNYYAAFRNGFPADKKGAIELFPGTVCTVTGTLLTIDTGERLWQLTAANVAEANEWLAILLSSIETAYPGGVLPESAEESCVDLPTLNVWLHKKGEGIGALTGEKRRFFVLQRAVNTGSLRIAYFAPDASDQPTVLKGKIVLYPSTTVEAQDSAILLTNEGRVWRLTAASADEAAAIAARLQSALEESYPRSAPAVTLDSEELETETEIVLSRSGGIWLVKKGEGLGAGDKRRLFVPVFGRSTRALKLNYYAECNSGVPADKKGCIVVTPFSDVSTVGANITIKNPDRTWQLTAASAEEAAGWVAAVRGLIAECRTSPHRMPLLGRLQALLADCDGNDGAAVRDTLAAEYGVDMVNLYSDDIDEAMRRLQREDSASSLGSATSTLSVVSVTGDDDEEELLGGEGVWLTKKGEGMGLFSDKKRFFVLRWGVQSHRLKFAYYEGVKKGVPHKRKGAIVIIPSTVIAASGKQLSIDVVDERLWQMTAASPEEAQRWAGILTDFVKERYRDGELQPSARDDDEDEQEIPGVALWLYKRGEGLGALARDKKRFFMLMWGEQSRQLKLCYYASLQHGHPVNRKGFIAITPRTMIEAAGKSITLINPDRTWHLSAENTREANELVQTLKSVAQDKFADEMDAIMADGSEAEVDLLPGRGLFMVKKADRLLSRDQRRYFTLAFGLGSRTLRLAYYAEVKDEIPLGRKGDIAISMLTSFRTAGPVLTVENPDRTWVLTAEEEGDIARLVESCRHCLGEQRVDVNNNMPLLARLYTMINDLVEADQPVNAEMLREALVREYGKATVELYADAIDKAASSSSNYRLPGAWFSKKAETVGKDRRRFFELGARDIKYYSHCENGRGVGLKGTIVLFPTTLVLQSGVELVIECPDRKWNLIAENARIAARWMRAIVLLLKKVFGSELPDDFDTDDDKGVILKSAWFLKKEDDGAQQRRWIVLMADMASLAKMTPSAATVSAGAAASPPTPNGSTSSQSGPNTSDAMDAGAPPAYPTPAPPAAAVPARLLCFRTLKGTAGEELLGKIVLSPHTAISYGDTKLLVKSEKKTFELYGEDDNVVLEWARELRDLRNGVLQSSPIYAEFLRRLELQERQDAENDMRVVKEREELQQRIFLEQEERRLRAQGLEPEAIEAIMKALAADPASSDAILAAHTAEAPAAHPAPASTDGVIVETTIDDVSKQSSATVTPAAAVAPAKEPTPSPMPEKKKKKKARFCLGCCAF